ncbi:uncharacterized protein LOC110734889 [Chenopodium quinoa]|uniref:uncharacterized protein LOC110734889 n=1 Tax=Chenopodium quinoa TaxID=63459 RepID=UPI000B78815E|nr:uncharacterized protein LOC110734889 [Chenopodium quinoa]
MDASPPGVVKINVDVALSMEGWVGLGAIARDCRGQILFSAVRRVRARWEPIVAKSKAVWFGVKKATDHGFRDVILETDSLLLASKLKRKSFSLAVVDSILEDIISASSILSSIFWSHVKRDGNYMAHHLARIVSYGSEQLWEYLVPNEISPYVLMDNLSIN